MHYQPPLQPSTVSRTPSVGVGDCPKTMQAVSNKATPTAHLFRTKTTITSLELSCVTPTNSTILYSQSRSTTVRPSQLAKQRRRP